MGTRARAAPGQRDGREKERQRPEKMSHISRIEERSSGASRCKKTAVKFLLMSRLAAGRAPRRPESPARRGIPLMTEIQSALSAIPLQVRPAPKATSSTTSPDRTRPDSISSVRASGTELEAVLP